MPNKNNHTVEYAVMAFLALVVMYLMICVSNTVDSSEYKQALIEQGLNAEEDSDFIAIYQLTESRLESGDKRISITDSTPKYLLYGVLFNFIWIAMISQEMQKKYAQERMYGDAEWGTTKQFKVLSSRHKRFYLTDYPPFSYVFHAFVYIKVFKETWKKGEDK